VIAERPTGPRLSQLLSPLLTAVVAAVLLALIGLELAFAVSWAMLLAAIVVARQSGAVLEDPGWSAAHSPFVTQRGSEVSRLAWSFVARTGAAGPTIVRRVRNLTRRRLDHRGIDIDDSTHHARADAMLGNNVRASLFQNHVTRIDIERALDAIERLPLTPESAEPVEPQHPDHDHHPAKED